MSKFYVTLYTGLMHNHFLKTCVRTLFYQMVAMKVVEIVTSLVVS